MSSGSLEEIKLVVENVKYKKVEGALYLMDERIAWMPKGKSTFAISHNYVDIKKGKAKIQLQVVLHDDSSSTFHFVAPGGAEKQLKDRDSVKDLLANLLPKFKQKINKELEDKKRILIENPHIYQLYNDFVVSQLISAEDFWSSFVNINDYRQEAKNQSTGVAQGFMANICPKSDGTSGLVYNITYDDIQSIFKTYPAVRLKFVQNVPQKMSEKDFWTKFFQSYYYRRDQINSTANDIFSDCPTKDDEEIKQQSEKILSDPVAIVGIQKSDFTGDDGFGLCDFSERRGTNVSNQNLIKRYNYYSMRVLSAMEENSLQRESEKPDKSNKTIASKAKKLKLDEEIVDLEKNDQSELRGAPLKLTHIDRYFYAPKINDSSKQAKILNSTYQNPLEICEKSLNEIRSYNMSIEKIVNSSLALGILVELSPGSQLMQTNNVQNLRDEIPKANQEEIKALYVSSCEILKTFHRMFPPKNAEQENKLKIMKEALETFYQQKVLLVQDRLNSANFPWNLTSHLENMFKIALSKYNTWKSKQGA